MSHPGGGGGGGGGFTYAANPRPVHSSSTATQQPSDRAMYRENPAFAATKASPESMNIMFDPRVVRGVTKGRPVLSAAAAAAQVAEQQQQQHQSGKSARALRDAERAKLIQAGLIRPQLKSTADIHAHIVVAKKRTPLDLSQFLVEQARPVATSNESAQTDKILTPPPTPPFRPRKVGKDVASQVEAPAVFDFDRDVTALVQLVVGHTIEQALVEVRQDERLKNVAAKQTVLDTKDAERAADAVQREMVESDREQRQQRLLADSQRRAAAEARVRTLLTSQQLARSLLGGLRERALDELEAQGVLQEPQARAVECVFLPWLMDAVRDKVAALRTAADLTDGILGEGLAQWRAEADGVQRERVAAAQRAVADAAREAEQARQRARVKLLIHTDLSETPVGPLRLTGLHAVADVEAQVLHWVATRLAEQRAQDGGDGHAALPARDRVRFLWAGAEVDGARPLHSLTPAQLSHVQMVVDPAPVDEAAEAAGNEEGDVMEGDGGEGDGGAADGGEYGGGDGAGDGDEGDEDA